MNFNNLQVDVLFPEEYTDMIAEITCDNRLVCRVNQECGFDTLVIELMNNESDTKWEFLFSDFEKALEYAKKRLWELRRVPGGSVEDDA